MTSPHQPWQHGHQPPPQHADYPAGQPPQQPHAAPAPGHPYPPPGMYGQPLYPQTAVTKTRRAFNHSKHIKWTVLTVGMWGVTGYPIAWAWNRFGPEKSVSTTRFQ